MKGIKERVNQRSVKVNVLKYWKRGKLLSSLDGMQKRRFDGERKGGDKSLRKGKWERKRERKEKGRGKEGLKK